METQILVGPRCSGKTTELIKLAHEKFAYMVLPNRANVDMVFRQSIEMGLDIPFPITYQELIEGRYHVRGIKGFVIDEIEMFLGYIAKVPVFGFTANSANIKTLKSHVSPEHLEYLRLMQEKVENNG